MVDMGRIYWKIDNTVETFDTLKSTLENFGLKAVKQKPLGSEYGFERVIDWETSGDLSFSTIWYKNLCTIRFGSWEHDLAEIRFDSIEGSYMPYADHDTIDFVYRGSCVFRLALERITE